MLKIKRTYAPGGSWKCWKCPINVFKHDGSKLPLHTEIVIILGFKNHDYLVEVLASELINSILGGNIE